MFKGTIAESRLFELVLRLMLIGAFVCLANMEVSALESVDGVYQIGSAEELAAFAKEVFDGFNHIDAVLTDDIDFRGRRETIGVQAIPYEGTFDGACHTITIDYGMHWGEFALFRFLGSDGVIKNLHVDGTITDPEYYVGGLVGGLRGGTISNCLVTVDINSNYGRECIYGGLVASATGYSLIENCIYAGKIEAPNGTQVGGLVGRVESPGLIIRNSLSICDISVRNVEQSSVVVHIKEPDWVTLQDVYYVDKGSEEVFGAQKITMDEVMNGEVFFSIMGKKLFSVEDQLLQKKTELHKADLSFWKGLCVSILVVAILVVVIIVLINHKREFSYRIEKLKLERAVWLANQHRALVDSTVPVPVQDSPEPDVAADVVFGNKDPRLTEIFNRLLRLMVEEETYKDTQLSQNVLARTLGTNTRYLSEAIKEGSDGMNYNTWLAQYRVNCALQILDETPTIDMDSLAAQSGFASRTTLFRHFKDVTGLSPTQYLKSRTKN